MMIRLPIVLRKELIDSARDRRALLTGLFPAIFGPLAMLMILSSAAENRDRNAITTLQVVGQEKAPDLITHLQRNGIEIQEFDGDPRAAIRARDAGAILSIPDDFGRRFSASKPATVHLFADRSLQSSDAAADRIGTLVETYSRSIGAFRLIAHGVNPVVASPVRLQLRDLSTRTSRAAMILGVLQMMILVAPFSGGLAVAIDTTAGERERKSLEPLLLHPVGASTLVGGKWLAVVAFGLLASLVAVLSTALALRFFSLEPLGVDPRFTPAMQIGVCALLVPLTLFASSLQMLAALFAKTFREAQTYLSLIALLPMITIMATIFSEGRTQAWMYSVPILGQQRLITSILRGEGVEMLQVGTTCTVTLVVAGVILGALTRLLRSERVVYGTS